MATCNKKFFINLILIFFFSTTCYSETNFKKLEKKTVSYLDFFLLKYENKLSKRAYTLGSQMLATRV